MISYFDTSVLLPSLVDSHENHILANDLIKRCKLEGQIATTTLHTYAELYTNLTRPSKTSENLDPLHAFDTIVNELGASMILVDLTRSDYEAALRRCADLSLVSTVIYDALHVQAAIKIGATIIYTDNLKDFTRLVTPDLNIEVRGIRIAP